MDLGYQKNQFFGSLGSQKGAEIAICVQGGLLKPPLMVGLSPMQNKVIWFMGFISFIVFVMLCVNFVSVCLKDQKWPQTDTKVTLHPPS